jgi:anti-sigma factor RsiW
MVRRLFFWRHPFGEEELSAHVDGRLSPAESARLERHLASCEACRRRLAELRAVVEGLHALPPVPVSRSFVLRPGQVKGMAPAAPVLGIQRALAFGPAGAAVAALLLFAVLVGVDLGTVGGGGVEEEGQATLAGAPAPEAEMPALSSALPPTAAPAPAPRDATGDEKAEAGASEYNAGTPVPAEEAAAAPPPAEADEGDGTGRWVLRGFEGAAGAAFLLAVAILVWQRRRGAERH